MGHLTYPTQTGFNVRVYAAGDAAISDDYETVRVYKAVGTRVVETSLYTLSDVDLADPLLLTSLFVEDGGSRLFRCHRFMNDGVEELVLA